MRGFTKKIIWFFGFNIYTDFSEYLYFLRKGLSFEHNETTAIIMLTIMLIPLFFMGDDEE